MDSWLREGLKVQIQAYLAKTPAAELRELLNWLKIENNLLAGIQYNPKTLKSFVHYQLTKFKAGLDVTKHKCGNGRPSIPKSKERQILQQFIGAKLLSQLSVRVLISDWTSQSSVRKSQMCGLLKMYGGS